MLYMRWERFFTRKTQFFEVKNDKESKIIQHLKIFIFTHKCFICAENAFLQGKTNFFKFKNFENLKF